MSELQAAAQVPDQLVLPIQRRQCLLRLKVHRRVQYAVESIVYHHQKVVVVLDSCARNTRARNLPDMANWEAIPTLEWHYIINTGRMNIELRSRYRHLHVYGGPDQQAHKHPVRTRNAQGVESSASRAIPGANYNFSAHIPNIIILEVQQLLCSIIIITYRLSGCMHTFVTSFSPFRQWQRLPIACPHNTRLQTFFSLFSPHFHQQHRIHTRTHTRSYSLLTGHAANMEHELRCNNLSCRALLSSTGQTDSNAIVTTCSRECALLHAAGRLFESIEG